jgi:hypothetical protein
VNQPGDSTQDLRAGQVTGDSDADQAEKHTRRFGRRCLTAGLIIVSFTYLFALTAALLTSNNWGNQDSQLFAVLGLITLLGGGTALILLGGIELLQRPVRARQRTGAAARDRNRILLERLSYDSHERFDILMGLVGPLPGRLNEMVQRLDQMTETIKTVPDYGRGVVDGMQVRNEALGPERP